MAMAKWTWNSRSARLAATLSAGPPPVPRRPKSQVPTPLASPPVVAVKDTFDRAVMPAVGPAPKFAPPPVVRRRLSNGLEVLIAERHELPILSLELVAKGGGTLERQVGAAVTANAGDSPSQMEFPGQQPRT